MGPIFKSSSPVDLTESEVEYVVRCIKHVFSHRTWFMHVYHFVLEHEIEGMYTLEEIEALPLSTAHLKVLKAYLKFM